MLNLTAESSAADVIVSFCAVSLVIEPPAANFPASTNAPPAATSAACEKSDVAFRGVAVRATN